MLQNIDVNDFLLFKEFYYLVPPKISRDSLANKEKLIKYAKDNQDKKAIPDYLVSYTNTHLANFLQTLPNDTQQPEFSKWDLSYMVGYLVFKTAQLYDYNLNIDADIIYQTQKSDDLKIAQFKTNTNGYVLLRVMEETSISYSFTFTNLKKLSQNKTSFYNELLDLFKIHFVGWDDPAISLNITNKDTLELVLYKPLSTLTHSISPHVLYSGETRKGTLPLAIDFNGKTIFSNSFNQNYVITMGSGLENSRYLNYFIYTLLATGQAGSVNVYSKNTLKLAENTSYVHFTKLDKVIQDTITEQNNQYETNVLSFLEKIYEQEKTPKKRYILLDNFKTLTFLTPDLINNYNQKNIYFVVLTTESITPFSFQEIHVSHDWFNSLGIRDFNETNPEIFIHENKTKFLTLSTGDYTHRHLIRIPFREDLSDLNTIFEPLFNYLDTL